MDPRSQQDADEEIREALDEELDETLDLLAHVNPQPRQGLHAPPPRFYDDEVW